MLFWSFVQVFEKKGHAVVCVAEGAGQDILHADGATGTDASGNPILKDIGPYLKNEFKKYFKVGDMDGLLKSR